jgi:hypothetical protein
MNAHINCNIDLLSAMSAPGPVAQIFLLHRRIVGSCRAATMTAFPLHRLGVPRRRKVPVSLS